MEYIMHLHKSPFERIRKGTKKIEGRLADEKRQNLRVGDRIKFISRENREEVIVEVTKLEKYEDLGKMFDGTDKKLWANDKLTKEKFVDSFPYYSKEEIGKYGMLAIYFRLIN